MEKKIDFYGPIKEEAGVIMAFTKLHEVLGFPKLVASSARGFDIDSIEYKGKNVTVEFEYYSSNFINHGHVEKMVDSKEYVVICWIDDCKLRSLVKNNYGKKIYDVIELHDKVNIKTSKIIEEPEKIKYILLSYNPSNADYMPISEWKKSNLYRCRTSFENKHIPVGSKVIIKQGDYIVGGFDVVRYEWIEKPNTENEWKLYQTLTNYPVGLFNETVDELKKDYSSGHIFYDNFFTLDKARISFKEQLPEVNISRDGRNYLTAEQYYKLIK